MRRPAQFAAICPMLRESVLTQINRLGPPTNTKIEERHRRFFDLDQCARELGQRLSARTERKCIQVDMRTTCGSVRLGAREKEGHGARANQTASVEPTPA